MTKRSKASIDVSYRADTSLIEVERGERMFELFVNMVIFAPGASPFSVCSLPQTYLTKSLSHDAKKRKIVNCGVVAFTLEQ